ncbi:hydroxyisourate hydrolase [Streptomyces sp. NPDC006798]|uniref:hydroxyisourate hydrolase n=1 Tax=Streptomyces sp. NPDC006798 TaxID=3155462 RepID=UPI0033D7CE38
MSTETTASVSTHVLDTSTGRPAHGVPVRLSARSGATAGWTECGGSTTGPDGRCQDLPAPPEDATRIRLDFGTETYFRTGAAGAHDGDPDPVFFPEVTVAFAVVPGEHYHVPLLLSPFGYSVYRGS